MSIPPNLDWPADLRQFKQDETERFVIDTMEPVTTCADCGEQLVQGDAKSLTVDVITNEPAPEGSFPMRRFVSYVTHTRCKISELTIQHDPNLGMPVETDVTWVYATLMLGEEGFPLVVYRLAGSNQVQIRSGDRVDVQTSYMLGAGFALAPSPELGDVLTVAGTQAPTEQAHATWVAPGRLQLVVTANGVDDPVVTIDVDDDRFLAAAEAVGAVLWVTGAGVELDTSAGSFVLERAAARGTLVAGITEIR